MPLSNNRELFDYLLSLGATLKERGASELSQMVLKASRHFAGMSTEFLGESRIALRKVSTDSVGVLNDLEHAQVVEVVEQINTAFDVANNPQLFRRPLS